MDPVQTTTGADSSEAANNAVESADEHTPETPELANPPASAPAPTDGEGGKDELHSLVQTLANQVNTLTETVAALAVKDSGTIKVPWTKRGGK